MNKNSWYPFLLAIVLAIAVPILISIGGAGALADIPVFQIPEVFQMALLGFVTYWLVKGLEVVFPPLVGLGAQIAAVIVAFLLDLLTKLINANVAPDFFTILADIFVLLATWLTAAGIKHLELVLLIRREDL